VDVRLVFLKRTKRSVMRLDPGPDDVS